MIEFRSISKNFRSSKFKINDINLKIDKNNLAVLVGPSGSGKSTILRLIAGLEHPTSGQIFIDGQDITFNAPKDRNIAMVFQNYALYPHLTVRQNIEFPLRVKKTNNNEIKKRLSETLDILEIDDLVDRYPRQLSGGQKQRVAIGRAIIRKPQVILFDEPLSNLDVRLRDSLRQQMKKLHQEIGQTTIYVTHDQHEALSLSQQLIVIEKGEIQQVGSPQKIYSNPDNLFTAEFIGYPKTNKIVGKINDSGMFYLGEDSYCKLNKIPNHYAAEVFGCIRPDAIKVYDEKSNSEDLKLEFELKSIEYWGSRSLLYFKRDELGIQVESENIDKPIKNKYYLEFPAESFIWFDKLGKVLSSEFS